MATFCEYVYDYLSDSLGKSSKHKGSKQISLRMELDNFPFVELPQKHIRTALAVTPRPSLCICAAVFSLNFSLIRLPKSASYWLHLIRQKFEKRRK